jgi:hypothetical protein
MHSQLHIAAQEHIADLRRAADHYRLVHAATSATSSHAVPAPRRRARPVPAPASPPPPGINAPVVRERYLERAQPQAHKQSRPEQAAAPPLEA